MPSRLAPDNRRRRSITVFYCLESLPNLNPSEIGTLWLTSPNLCFRIAIFFICTSHPVPAGIWFGDCLKAKLPIHDPRKRSMPRAIPAFNNNLKRHKRREAWSRLPDVFLKFRKQEAQNLAKNMLTTIPCADVNYWLQTRWADAFEMVSVRRCISDIAGPYFKGEVKSFFLFHNWVRIKQTRTSVGRRWIKCCLLWLFFNVVIGTEGALGRPMTYDNQAHPPTKPLFSSKQALDLSRPPIN